MNLLCQFFPENRYAYDNKGLMISRSESIIDRLEEYEYDQFDRLTNQPTQITQGGHNGVVALYIADLFHDPTGNGEDPRYTVTTVAEEMYHIHTDHLGSYCAITDANKEVIQRNYFDPWGNHKQLFKNRGIPPEDPQADTIINFTLTDRGFTGHEHYPYFKIINMNGRLYDPIIGRFFSPDNYVQLPEFTQGYNRYSYALNNPLKYKDPTGQWYEDFYSDDYDYGGNPTVLDPVEIVTTSNSSNFDVFGNLWGMEYDMYGDIDTDYEVNGKIRTINDGVNNLRIPNITPRQFNRLQRLANRGGNGYENYRNKLAAANGFYTFNTFDGSNGLPGFNMTYFSSGGVLPDLLSQRFVGAVGIFGNTFGGSAAWAAAETAFEAGRWSNSLKIVRVGGNALGGVGTVMTGVNTYIKWNNGKVNTSDWVDFGASTGLLAAGLMLSNPVGIGIVVIGGVVYGIVRLSSGDDIDRWINNNFGYRKF